MALEPLAPETRNYIDGALVYDRDDRALQTAGLRAIPQMAVRPHPPGVGGLHT